MPKKNFSTLQDDPQDERVLNAYRNSGYTTGVTVSLRAIIKRIRDGDRQLAEKTETCNILANGDKDVYRDYRAKNLPAVTFSGIFPKGKRTAQHLQRHSGLVTIDIDDLNPSDIGCLLAELSKMPQVVLAFVSRSGNGIKVIVPIDPIPRDALEHKGAFKACVDFFDDLATECNFEIDPRGSDCSRLCFLAHDPLVIVNETPTSIEWDRDEYLESLQNAAPVSNNSDFDGNVDIAALEFISREEGAAMTRQELLAMCRLRGAIGFNYTKTDVGEIDSYRFVFAFEGITPMVPLEPVVFEPAFDLIPSPEELEPSKEELPFQNIPDALRSVSRWSVWKRIENGRKIPYEVLDGGFWSESKRCKSDTQAMWVSFDEALHCFLKSNGHLGGLSFALGDGWCGFDFDDVIVDGNVHPQVQSWLARLGGYQEVSQSGKGIKVILRGSLSDDFLGTAPTGRQFKGIPSAGMVTEVYHCRRFFFLTGNGEGEPNENQSVIDEICRELTARKAAMQPKPKRSRSQLQPVSSDVSLSDDAVLDKIRNSRQAVKFESLWNGQIGTYQSASEADMALTGLLMWWCGNDTSQVERLFSESGLAKREKWDREDYRVRTLAKAEQSSVYSPRVPKGYAEALKRAKGVQNDG